MQKRNSSHAGLMGKALNFVRRVIHSQADSYPRIFRSSHMTEEVHHHQQCEWD